ncbi:MAG TPA: hypothetical protein VN714_15155 [Trebonia sp.]|nr:hypothetical protein [Trebonia sp.]
MIRKIALAAAPLAALGGLALGTGAARAATVQYANPVAFGAGASASYASGTWTLDSGHGAGGSAQVQLVHPGTAATAPTFTASTEFAGNPRWVIQFHNGDYLFGNPAAGSNASNLSWTLEPSGKAEPSYAAALADAQAGGSDDTVTAAFIVLDTGNPDQTVHLTGVTYNGNSVVQATPPAPKPFVYNGHVVTVSNNRATVAWNESRLGWPDPASKCEEVQIFGYGFSPNGSPHIGFTCDHSGSNTNEGFLTGLAAGHTYALRVQPAVGTYGNHHPIPGTNANAHITVITTR